VTSDNIQMSGDNMQVSVSSNSMTRGNMQVINIVCDSISSG